MRHVVIGAGAMGCLYGGLLADAGEDVRLLDVREAHVAAINRDGLRLDGITGDRRIRVPAFTDPRALSGSADIVLFHTDTNNTSAGAEAAAVALKPGGFAITLQNGIGNVEILSEVLGAGRVLGGVSYHSATISGDGHATHTNAGPTWLGELDGGESARAAALAATLAAAGFQPELSDDIMGVIWTKFFHNCGVNGLCAASGLRSGEMARDPAAARLQTLILEEAMAVVAARGIRLRHADPIAHVKRECWRKFNKPSMQQHVEMGRRTEIDALNGAICREGKALGIPTPYNEALVMMIKAREAAAIQAASGAEPDYAALEAVAEADLAAGRGPSE